MDEIQVSAGGGGVEGESSEKHSFNYVPGLLRTIQHRPTRHQMNNRTKPQKSKNYLSSLETHDYTKAL